MSSFISRTVFRKVLSNSSEKYILRQLQTLNCAPLMPTANFGKISCNWLIDHNNGEGINKMLSRTYSKGKDRKKEKGKGKVVINEVQIAELVNVDSIKIQMNDSLEQMKEDFMKHVSIRSTAGSIESIPVLFDGGEHILQELAQISRKNPKSLVINMSTFPQATPEVLKAIQKSGLNLNPQQEGTTIYIPLPKVTKEHRENLSKNAKQFFVKCKTSIREVQLKYTKVLKKKDSVSEDLIRNVEQQLKALADKYILEGEQILERKQRELLGNELN